jgi:hypothetical protein
MKNIYPFLWTATHNKLSCTCGLIWNFLIVLICANLFSLFIVLEHSDTICSIKIRLTIQSDWSQPIWFWNSPTFVFILFLSCFRIIYSLNFLFYAVVLIIYFQIIQLGKKWNGKQYRSPLGKSQVDRNLRSGNFILIHKYMIVYYEWPFMTKKYGWIFFMHRDNFKILGYF